jgi:hypothetical protein
MSNNKQLTAVEWFSNKTWRLKVQLENKEITIGEYGVTYVELLEQAKEMEKEQMLECYLKADVFPRKYEFEKWYNETYGGNK